MSKGSAPGPLSVPQETFAERWEIAFGKQPEASPQPTAPAIGRLVEAYTVEREFETVHVEVYEVP